MDRKFSAPELSSSELSAFEDRAIQKLQDFHEYLTIISDTTYDSVFVAQAKSLALGSFSDEECSILLEVIGQEKVTAIRQILEDHAAGAFGKLTFQITDISVNKKLSADGAGTYSGSLVFGLATAENPERDQLTALIELRKVEKKFGDDTKSVWSVFLCDIN